MVQGKLKFLGARTESATAQKRTPLPLWAFAVFYLVLHGVVATCLRDRLAPLSTLCVVLAEVVAIAAAVRTARRTEAPAQVLWWVLAFGILLHSIAMSLDMVMEATGAPVFNYVPKFSVFFSMLSGLPLLAATSIPFDRRILSVARITHSLLSLAIGALIYLHIVSLLSVHGSTNPAHAMLILRWFDGIDLYLALAATIRWGGSEKPQERVFFSVASIFLWLNALFPAIHNRILIRHDYVWLDLLIAAPYVALCTLMLTARRHPPRMPSERMVHVVQSSSPIFLSIALLVIGVATSRTHFYLGLSAALLSVVGYGALNVLAQIRARKTEDSLRASKMALDELVRLDSLTGIPNRRAFDNLLNRECAAARRTKRSVSLLMIDVDHFKQLNDTKGHYSGDACLIQIAAALRAALPRTTDFVSRYGGDEFAAILPATDRAGAAEVATRLCGAVSALRLSHPASPFGIVTITIGWSTFDGLLPHSQVSLALAADRALYSAKRNGRNRCECFSIDAVEA